MKYVETYSANLRISKHLYFRWYIKEITTSKFFSLFSPIILIGWKRFIKNMQYSKKFFNKWKTIKPNQFLFIHALYHNTIVLLLSIKVNAFMRGQIAFAVQDRFVEALCYIVIVTGFLDFHWGTSFVCICTSFYCNIHRCVSSTGMLTMIKLILTIGVIQR